MPSWNTDKGGDLIYNNERFEIKGFISFGPSSFGPKEMWDVLYFVDAIDVLNKHFKVYEIKLSNTSEIFRNIKFNNKETFDQIASSGKRPRAEFYKQIKPQIDNYCQLIFDGHVSKLEVTIMEEEWAKQ